MPAGDGTGPMGMGPRTGRGAGFCAGYPAPGWANRGPGRGFFGRRGRDIRRGFGSGGWGWRHWYYTTGLPHWARWDAPPSTAYDAAHPSLSREQEVQMPQEEAEWLKSQFDAINKRLDELSQE